MSRSAAGHPPAVIGVALAALLVASCAGSDAQGSGAPTPADTGSFAEPAPSSTTTTVDPCPALAAEQGAPLPPQQQAALDSSLADLLAAAPGSEASVSIRIDGHGEVLAHQADLALSPASNQKLLTAYAALNLLDPFSGLATAVDATAPADSEGVVEGDLVLVPGGDPTLTTRGAHSLDALAAEVAGTGAKTVTGSLLLDDSRHEHVLIPPGWPDHHVPTYGGPLSVLMVDDNEGRDDAAFLADPNLEHTRTFGRLLAEHGVSVAGRVERVTEPVGDALPIASLESPPVGSLVADLLLTSDNETADLLLREVGSGRLADGAARTLELFTERGCLRLDGGIADGSGVSRDDRRSARDLRRIVDLLLVDPLGPAILEALPVGARSGTLAGRFGGSSGEGVVTAKSGSIIGGKALTGRTTTADGVTATFSVLVNGPDAAAAEAAIDALVARISDPIPPS